MEDANMSQSAGQSAIGSVPPDGESGVKRQVSADAFRALTERLKPKNPQNPNPVPPQAPPMPAQAFEAPAPQAGIMQPVSASEMVAPAELQAVDVPPEMVPEAIPVQTPEMVTPAEPQDVTVPPVMAPEVATAPTPEMVAPAEIPVEMVAPAEPQGVAVQLEMAPEPSLSPAPEMVAPAEIPVEMVAPVEMPAEMIAPVDLQSAAAPLPEAAIPEQMPPFAVEAEQNVRPEIPSFEVPQFEMPVVEFPQAQTEAIDPVTIQTEAATFEPPVPEVTEPVAVQINTIQADPAIVPQSAAATIPQDEPQEASEAQMAEMPSLGAEPSLEMLLKEYHASTGTNAQSATTATSMIQTEPTVQVGQVAQAAPSASVAGDAPDLVEAIQPETEPAPAIPVDLPVDPLQAAMELVKSSSINTDFTQPTVYPGNDFSGAETAPVSSQPEIDTGSQNKPIEPVEVEVPVAESRPERPKKAKKPAAEHVKQARPKASAPPVIGDANETVVYYEPDEESGATARALLDMMSSTSGGSQPQERALAADTLLQLIPRMMVKDLVPLSERVCMMEDAPTLLVKALINHKDARVAAPLLEDGFVVGEQDLLRLIASTEVERLIMMAKRRKVTPTVCDALIARGEPSVYLTLVRNPGAELSHDAFVAFCEIAKSQPSLQAPLATRGDTPPPIAFELFWSLPVQLRRYVLSRFLTDSATLDKILKLTQSVDSGSVGEHKFPAKRKIEALIELIVDGVSDKAAEMLATLANINEDNARRILADPDGEPMTAAFKAMGVPRILFGESIKKCANSSKAMLRSDRDLQELQVMFDSLSFNKARTLLTYWDWAIEKTGPYTRRVM